MKVKTMRIEGKDLTQAQIEQLPTWVLKRTKEKVEDTTFIFTECGTNYIQTVVKR